MTIGDGSKTIDTPISHSPCDDLYSRSERLYLLVDGQETQVPEFIKFDIDSQTVIIESPSKTDEGDYSIVVEAVLNDNQSTKAELDF